MPLTFLFLLALMVLGFVAAFLIRRATASRSRVTEPSCGKCGYCVRGLQSLVCPECGSDLREVGIVTPGSTKPFPAAARLALWTALAIVPAALIAQIVAPHITPYVTTATRQRSVFIQSPQINRTIQVTQSGWRRTIGRQSRTAIPVDVMALHLNKSLSVMSVDLRTGGAAFTDSTGKLVPGLFDAAFVARWLSAAGETDPSVADRAQDVVAAIDEMKDGGGGGFSRFAPDPNTQGRFWVTAHPAAPAFVTSRVTTPIGQLIPWVVMALVWLAGLPFVLRRSRVQSGRDADQA